MTKEASHFHYDFAKLTANDYLIRHIVHGDFYCLN